MKKLRIIMTVAAVFYLFCIYFIPFMQPLQGDIFAWIFFGLYVLILIFIWSIHRKHSYDPMIDEENENSDILKEHIKEKSRWNY